MLLCLFFFNITLSLSPQLSECMLCLERSLTTPITITSNSICFNLVYVKSFLFVFVLFPGEQNVVSFHLLMIPGHQIVNLNNNELVVCTQDDTCQLSY